MYASVGYGTTLISQIMPKLKEKYKEYYKPDDISLKDLEAIESTSNKKSTMGLIFDGIDNIEVKLAKCCNPVPGDEIVGYVTRGRGVSVHRADCPNMKGVNPGRF